MKEKDSQLGMKKKEREKEKQCEELGFEIYKATQLSNK